MGTHDAFSTAQAPKVCFLLQPGVVERNNRKENPVGKVEIMGLQGILRFSGLKSFFFLLEIGLSFVDIFSRGDKILM